MLVLLKKSPYGDFAGSRCSFICRHLPSYGSRSHALRSLPAWTSARAALRGGCLPLNPMRRRHGGSRSLLHSPFFSLMSNAA